MTFQEFAMKYLTDRGMFDSQANAVIEMVKSYQPSFADRWQDDIDGYPEVMQDVIAVSLNSSAIDWIDANLPKAWYRPVFVQ